jgi:inorganic pyrophosphatase
MTDMFVNVLLGVPPIVGILWAIVQTKWVSSIELKEPGGDEEEMKQITSGLLKSSETLAKMSEIAGAISQGADSFLRIQYAWIAGFCILFSGVILAFFKFTLEKGDLGLATTVCFLIGAFTSMLSGWIGMKAAVMCNVRTAHQCWAEGIEAGFATAVRGGSILGFALVSLGIGMMLLTIQGLNRWGVEDGTLVSCMEALAGFGLGGSAVALFGRVGGGIYTKAADVGADLSGKNEYGMDEDDPRNPACIADNVGDNVGDIAGMGADLFGSFAESTCAALIIAAKSYEAKPAGDVAGLANSYAGLNFPILVSSTGVIVGLVTLLVVLNVPYFYVRSTAHIEPTLKNVLILSTVLQSIVVIFLKSVLPSSFKLALDNGDLVTHTPWDIITPVLIGLWSGLIIGIVTEYYTSHSYRPVREISETQRVSAATGIIYGLALGYLSCIVPILLLVVTVIISHSCSGMYGVALAALGMLSTLTLGLTIDAYGPISDNAGGIAEMSGMGSSTRELTDALDAAGNTTAAIGKGFAIGSAALVSLALFAAFKVRAGVTVVDVSQPWTWSGLLIGAMLPYAFSALTMKSVGIAAADMVQECMRQFPLIIRQGVAPDYETCISISTAASLKEMIAPGALVIFSPLVVGVLFGKDCVSGLLSGILVSGVQLAISMSNTGGAWDNAKKYIEKGGLGPDHPKGSAAHKNAVTGDTVGDPLKDTSGPSLNILVKLSAIISLVFAEVFAKGSLFGSA